MNPLGAMLSEQAWAPLTSGDRRVTTPAACIKDLTPASIDERIIFQAIDADSADCFLPPPTNWSKARANIVDEERAKRAEQTKFAIHLADWHARLDVNPATNLRAEKTFFMA